MEFKSISVRVLSVGRAVHSAGVPDIKQTVDMQGVLYDEANKWPIKCGKRSCGGGRAGSAVHLVDNDRAKVSNQAGKNTSMPSVS
jgi:hypothetical protein